MRKRAEALFSPSSFHRVLLAYFACSGLDVIDKLDKLPHTKESLIEWVYSHQITESLQSTHFIRMYKSFVQIKHLLIT
jgi:hypothetical protein